jgi:hypothetical protein
MRSFLLLTILLPLLTQVTQAAGLPSKTAPDVPKKEWLESMKSLLPALLCKKTGYFRHCFRVDEDECLEEALRATKICLLKSGDDIPETLHQPSDGAKWGKEAGACTGGTLELALTTEKKKKALKKCDDSSKWPEY